MVNSLDIKVIVTRLEKTMQCCCDLDNWQPENDTNHSCVCPIHKEAQRLCKNKE